MPATCTTARGVCTTISTSAQQISGARPLPTAALERYGSYIIRGDGDQHARHHLMANLPNTGLITNLPRLFRFEVPCVVDGKRHPARPRGPLPSVLAALNRSNICRARAGRVGSLAGRPRAIVHALIARPAHRSGCTLPSIRRHGRPTVRRRARLAAAVSARRKPIKGPAGCGGASLLSARA